MMIKPAHLLSLSLLSAGLAFNAAAAHAQPPRPFSFFGVEFEDHDQRVPLAQAYVASTMAPGTSMADAEAAARRAVARCSRPGFDGVVDCRESSSQRPAGRGMDDVLWLVRITPAPDGTVARAVVTRTVAGM